MKEIKAKDYGWWPANKLRIEMSQQKLKEDVEQRGINDSPLLKALIVHSGLDIQLEEAYQIFMAQINDDDVVVICSN